MSDRADDIGRPSNGPAPPQFSEVFSRTFEQPDETTGRTDGARWVVVQLRRDWPLMMLLPFLIALLCIAFFVGRVTSWDRHQRLSTPGDGGSEKSDALPAANDATIAMNILPPRPSAATTSLKAEKPKPDATSATVDSEHHAGVPGIANAFEAREKEAVGAPRRIIAESGRPKSGVIAGLAHDALEDIRREAESKKARIVEMEKLMDEVRTEAEGRRQDEALENRLLHSRGNRPLPMGQIHTIHRAQLLRDLENQRRNLRDAPLDDQVDVLRPGSVWSGERSYREGGYAGVTVPYEIHVDQRNGPEFKGRKFDNGPGRNRAEVEGWIVGRMISWVERAEHSVLTMKGTLKDNVISLTFRGVYNNGVTNVGDANLSRGLKSRSIELHGKDLQEAASEIAEHIANMRNPAGSPTPAHLRGRRGLILNNNNMIPDPAVHSAFVTAFEAVETTAGRLRQGPAPDGDYDTLIRQLVTVIGTLEDMLRVAPDRDVAIDDLRSRFEEILKNVRTMERPKSQLERSGFELYQQGILFSQQGQLASAWERFQQALASLRQSFPNQSHPSLVCVLSEMGKVLKNQGQYTQALEYYRQAMEMHQRLFADQDHSELISILTGIGTVLNRQGAHAQALNYHRKALEMNKRLYSKPEEPTRPVILSNIGSALHAQGEHTQALEYFRQALTMNERLHPNQDDPDVAKCLNNVGLIAHVLGDYQTAYEYYLRSLVMKTRLHSVKDHPDIPVSLNNVGFVLWRQGDAEGAIAYHQRALAVCTRLYAGRDHPAIANSLDNVAFGHSKNGKELQALDDAFKAFEMRKRLYPQELYRDGHRDILRSLDLLGQLLHFQGKDDQALPLVQRAVAMRDALSVNFFVGASETETLNFLGDLSPSSKDLLISISRNSHDAEALLYASIWNCKAMVSRMMQQRQQALIRAGDPATLDIGRELLTVRHKLAGMLLAPVDSSGNLARQVQTLTGQKEQLERQLKDHLPELRRHLALDSRPASDLSLSLPEGSVFIDIIQYVDAQQDPKEPGEKGQRFIPSFVAFVVRPGREPAPVFLGPSKPIEEAAAGWRRILLDEKRADAEAVAFRTTLRSLIWDKLERLFPPGTSTVLISPDSTLTQLPWAALPGRDSAGVLLEDYALAIVPSGSFLLDALSSERDAGNMADEWLCVGDVAYGEPPAAPLSTTADRPVVWPQLEATREELGAIATLAGTRRVAMLTQERANTAALLAALPRARWAHLATHGFFADRVFRSNFRMDESQFLAGDGSLERFAPGSRSPMALSGLVLAGANLPRPTDAFGVPQGDGGVLTAEAIAGLSLTRLELVVLSACETGLGEVTRNEGVFGLQRAFHTAGARNVVASLWRVRSGATSALMKRFYRKLSTNAKGPIEALREAQLELYRHPELMSHSDPARGPDLTRTEKIGGTIDGAASSGHARMRLWAGFILSGAGR